MTLTLTIPDEPEDYGPAMLALKERERAFVKAMTLGGAVKNLPELAAVAAGYADEKYGWTLVRKEKIRAAIREEAGVLLQQGALIGAKALMEIAQDSTHRDRLKAANALLAHNGYATEQKITVEHAAAPSAKQMIEDIKAMAKLLGVDPARLLGQAGIVIDAEFEVVPPAA